MTAVEKEQLVNTLETKAGVLELIIMRTDDEAIKEEGHMLLDMFYDIPEEGISTIEAKALLEDMLNFIEINK